LKIKPQISISRANARLLADLSEDSQANDCVGFTNFPPFHSGALVHRDGKAAIPTGFPAQKTLLFAFLKA